MASDPIRPLDASLRLQSAGVALAPLVGRLGLPVRHLHVLGQPMATLGPLKDRPARRHYAALAQARMRGSLELRAWTEDVTAKVRADPALVAALQSGDIEGTIWIAVLSAEPTPMPGVDPSSVEAARELGLGLFIENYTDLVEETGLPRQTWLVEAASKEHSSPVDRGTPPARVRPKGAD